MLYNDSNFKSSAHISDTPHKTLILAEMILNNSSLQLIDNGKHTDTFLDTLTLLSLYIPDELSQGMEFF
jgi:hypothetical protein